MVYNATETDRRIRELRNGKGVLCVVSGEPGSGKSVVLASCPVPEGKIRLALDYEGSMADLDAGPQGEDVYLPRKLSFRMERKEFPTFEDFLQTYERIHKGDIGALLIDNIKLCQVELQNAVIRLSATPAALRKQLARIEMDLELPVDGLVRKWVRNQDKLFWVCLKGIVRRMILECARQKINFIGSTEERNLWVGINTPDERIVDRKASLWDAWYSYIDFIAKLERKANTIEPPMAYLYKHQPKMRIPGMNPVWRMDWEGFRTELETAKGRTSEPIPEDKMIPAGVAQEEPEGYTESNKAGMNAAGNKVLNQLLLEGKKKGLSTEQVKTMLRAHQITLPSQLIIEPYEKLVSWLNNGSGETAELTHEIRIGTGVGIGDGMA